MSSSFFRSELVRGDLQEMTELQAYCMKAMYTFPAFSPEKKKEYFINLRRLIEKQEIFYARLKLTDDPEAKMLLDNLRQAAILFGASERDNVEEMFKELLEKITHMQSVLEAEGG